MLEIKFKVDAIDYDEAIELILPKLAEKESKLGVLAKRHGSLFKKIAHHFVKMKGQRGTEEFLAALAKKKNDLLIEKMTAFAEEKGLNVLIAEFSVKSE